MNDRENLFLDLVQLFLTGYCAYGIYKANQHMQENEKQKLINDYLSTPQGKDYIRRITHEL